MLLVVQQSRRLTTQSFCLLTHQRSTRLHMHMHIHAYAYACAYIYTCTRTYTEYALVGRSTNKESVLLVVQQSRRFEIVAVKAGGSGGQEDLRSSPSRPGGAVAAVRVRASTHTHTRARRLYWWCFNNQQDSVGGGSTCWWFNNQED